MTRLTISGQSHASVWIGVKDREWRHGLGKVFGERVRGWGVKKKKGENRRGRNMSESWREVYRRRWDKTERG